MFLVDTSWDVSCAQYLPLVFRSLCASLLVVMTEMRRYMISMCRGFFLGTKVSLKQQKTYRWRQTSEYTTSCTEQKVDPPKKQLADLLWPCNNKKRRQTYAKQCLQIRKTKTIKRFRKFMKQLLRIFSFFGYDVLMTFPA